jgi:hypothetical protein
MNIEQHNINIYLPINSGEYREISTENKKKKMIYILIFILLFALFATSTYDIIYWKNKCSFTESTNYLFNNSTNNLSDNNKLNCYIFLYGITFYVYFLFFVLSFVVLQLQNCYFNGEENSCLICILNATSNFLFFVLSILVYLMLFIMALFRNILYIFICVTYLKCKNYNNDINIDINIAVFSSEFILNIIVILFFAFYAISKL